MRRNLVAVLSFAGFCLTGSVTVIAQQAGGQTSGVTVQGLQAVTAGVRDTQQPGELIGGTGEGIGNLRGQNNATGQVARPRTSGFSGQRQLNQLFNQLNSGFMSSRDLRKQLRFPVSLGFKPMAQSIQAVSGERVQNRLARIPQLRENGPLTVEMDGRIAVLQGEVASEDARDLVARVVLLEPGISDVQNELRVAKPKTAP